MTQLVNIINNQVKTTSNIIAETFGKAHKNVLQKIESLEIPAEWHRLNFQPMVKTVDIGSGATRQDKAYEITRDGFTLLAMGFTGKKAMEFKIAYINAFNEMERQLIQLSQPDPTQKQLELVPVREHTRRLPSAPREIKLSEKARSEIGGIVKSCVGVAIRDALKPICVSQFKTDETQSETERNLYMAIKAYGDERERNGLINALQNYKTYFEIADLLKQAKPIQITAK